MRIRRRRRFAVLLVAATAVGCGVQLQTTAEVVPDDEVPYDLLSPTTSMLQRQGPDAATSICLLTGDSLVVLSRSVSGTPPLDTAVSRVRAAPTEAESKLGVRSVIEADDVDEVKVDDGEAIVSLAPEFSLLAADQQLLAVAQMTCTLTGQPGVDSVRFELDGTPVAVPVVGGEMVQRPVGRSDYQSLILN